MQNLRKTNIFIENHCKTLGKPIFSWKSLQNLRKTKICIKNLKKPRKNQKKQKKQSWRSLASPPRLLARLLQDWFFGFFWFFPRFFKVFGGTYWFSIGKPKNQSWGGLPKEPPNCPQEALRSQEPFTSIYLFRVDRHQAENNFLHCTVLIFDGFRWY